MNEIKFSPKKIIQEINLHVLRKKSLLLKSDYENELFLKFNAGTKAPKYFKKCKQKMNTHVEEDFRAASLNYIAVVVH